MSYKGYTVVMGFTPWNLLIEYGINPQENIKKKKQKNYVMTSSEGICNHNKLELEWEWIWKIHCSCPYSIMKSRIEPYSYSLNHFYWRKNLARKEKSTNEPSVNYGNYDDKRFAEQYITQRFLLSVSTVMLLFYAMSPEIQSIYINSQGP